MYMTNQLQHSLTAPGKIVLKIVKCLSCLLQVIQIWVYDIKRTELLKPLSCTDANSTNPEAKYGLLFIKCR